jgi:hypothetical protein
MYNITGTDKWIMIMDEYSQGTFFPQITEDFQNFTRIRRGDMKIDHIKPRHGSVVAISEDEYHTLTAHYGVEK